MGFFGFLKDKAFYIHLIIIILAVVGLFELVFGVLDKFTRHGEEYGVPDFIGMDYREMEQRYGEDYTFILLDTIYVKNFPEGAVYQQNPKPDSKVKKGRNIYYVRTCISPEMVAMPNLRNLSLRQAMVTLNSNGLLVDRLVFVDHFARNAVVNQFFEDDVVEPGVMLQKGSHVTLEVGYGNGERLTNIPDLIGVPKSKVQSTIHNASLNLGNEIFIDRAHDSLMRVFSMEPVYGKDVFVELGSKVDVSYRSAALFDFDSYLKELFRKDSMVNAMEKNRIPVAEIQIVRDSFDFILTKRSFSFDSIKRVRDKELKFIRPVVIDIEEDYNDEEDNSVFEIEYDDSEYEF